jgi:hypothetical protein
MIDAVYTWVDGDDQQWLAQKCAAMRELDGEHHESAVADSRFKCRDELRYSFRSLEQHAPFIRRVHLVSAGQVPPWLDVSHPDLHLVHHEEIFPDRSHLPTFNSHAIEAQLHNIPGLSEYFLYLNDDVFFRAATTAADFFDDQDRCIFYLDRRKVQWRKNGLHYDHPVSCAARNNSRLLEKTFSHRITRRLDHVPHALRRSTLEEIWKRYPKELDATSSHRFRNADDLSMASSLAHYYGLCTNTAIAVETCHSTYLKIKKWPLSSYVLGAELLRQYLSPPPNDKFLSINDAGRLDDSRFTNWAVGKFLEATYPKPSRFEV